jgi:hypothetical protein
MATTTLTAVPATHERAYLVQMTHNETEAVIAVLEHQAGLLDYAARIQHGYDYDPAQRAATIRTFAARLRELTGTTE